MDPLPHTPRTFRDIVEADLRRAARLVVKVQDEIDPQLRIATREGDYWLAVSLPPAASERSAMLARIGTLLAWKQALAFTFASELAAPDAVCCIGIAPGERHMCLAPIERTPRPWTKANFGAVEWPPPGSIDPVVAELLPERPRALTPKEVAEAERWFGTNGRFPVVHIPSGEVRGLG